MAQSAFRTILVIGNNHEEIVKKYSADTKVNNYLVMKLDSAGKERKKRLNMLKAVIEDKVLRINKTSLYDKMKEMYLLIDGMSDFDFFRYATEGCYYDEETGDAYSDENPNAFYQYERCQQHRLDVTGEEGDFSNPFPLKNGAISYSAHFKDIDWDKINRNEKAIKTHERVWDLVVNNEEPQNENERFWKKSMSNRRDYFANFKTKEEFVNHSTSLWYWGVATEGKYEEIDYRTSEKDWVSGFFDKYIKKLSKDNPLITIYEVKALD